MGWNVPRRTSALEVGNHQGYEIAASVLVAATFLAVVVVVLLDRTTVADHEAIMVRAAMGEFDDHSALRALQRDEMISVLNNDAVVRQVRWGTGIALLLALASAGVAVYSMLT